MTPISPLQRMCADVLCGRDCNGQHCLCDFPKLHSDFGRLLIGAVAVRVYFSTSQNLRLSGVQRVPDARIASSPLTPSQYPTGRIHAGARVAGLSRVVAADFRLLRCLVVNIVLYIVAFLVCYLVSLASWSVPGCTESMIDPIVLRSVK